MQSSLKNNYLRLYGLIGAPISHTLSPAMHNGSLERLDILGAYLPIETDLSSEEDAKEFLDWAWQMGVDGFNVTLPYKELFASVLSSSLPSVNTLVRSEKGWQGFSTDGVGFLNAARRLAHQLRRSFQPSALVILGNGGAAKALAYYWGHKYPSCPIFVLRRSKAGDHKWNALSGIKVRFVDFDSTNLKQVLMRLDDQVVVAQATSAPLYGDPLESLIPAFEKFQGLFIDMVYGKPSAIVEDLLSKGGAAMDGLPMLIEQALASQELWWGRRDLFENLEDDIKASQRSYG